MESARRYRLGSTPGYLFAAEAVCQHFYKDYSAPHSRHLEQWPYETAIQKTGKDKGQPCLNRKLKGWLICGAPQLHGLQAYNDDDNLYAGPATQPFNLLRVTLDVKIFPSVQQSGTSAR
jgi:hypothetical protein